MAVPEPDNTWKKSEKKGPSVSQVPGCNLQIYSS